MSNVPLPLHAARSGHDVTTLLVAWYEQCGRDFPWRLPRDVRAGAGKAPLHDPYMILLCEVMLQQTGTARVVEKLPRFLDRFPTVEALADAPVADLIRAWKGMGYNRRVLSLRGAARAIVSRFDGVIPSSTDDLRSLPGIGRYTAAAICCFAFGRAVPVVDVNIVRVLGRIFQKCHGDSIRPAEQIVWRIDEAILPADDAYRWHQALMDLGATICLPAAPRCSICPVERHCLSAFPPSLRLFDATKSGRAEPSILGAPRRIWRGRMIEILRHEPEGQRVGDLLDRLLPLLYEQRDRRLLCGIVESLRADGLLRAYDMVREGELGESDRVGL